MLPYIALGERLGTFLAQSCEGGVEEMGLSYSGEIAEWKTALIRNAAVAGALNQIAHAQERANLVNAASIAEERGIRLTERKKTRDAGGAAANVLRMTFKTGQQENTVAGCVQPGGLPRLLEIDGIHVEAPLEGNVIYLRNLDVPGVIGRVGTVLGQHNVNIANFSLGRGRTGRRRRQSPWCRSTAKSPSRCWKRCAASRPSCWPKQFASQLRSRKRFRPDCKAALDLIPARHNRVFHNRFVSGHGFSRAAMVSNKLGLQPLRICLAGAEALIFVRWIGTTKVVP